MLDPIIGCWLKPMLRRVAGSLGSHIIAVRLLKVSMSHRTRLTTTRDRNLQFWGAVSTGFFEFSPVDFCHFSPGLLCNLVRKAPQNMENFARFPGGEKRVESCHVSGCQGFFGPECLDLSSDPLSSLAEISVSA